MKKNSTDTLIARLELFPIIAAVQEHKFQAAINSPSEVIFCLDPRLSTIRERTAQAHAAGKLLFVHLAMAAGISQDKVGMFRIAAVSPKLSLPPRESNPL